MLRASEFTAPTVLTFHPTVMLLPQDITFNNSSMLVYIKASKTDPFCAGTFFENINTEQSPLSCYSYASILTLARL